MGFGIRTKVILLALLCAVLPSALISFIAFGSSREALEKGVRIELSSLAQDQLGRLLSSLKRARSDLGTWSALHAFRKLDDNKQGVRGELAVLQKRHPSLGDLLVVDPRGTVVAAASGRNEGATLAQEAFLAPVLKGVPFQGLPRHEALIGRTGIVLASPIRADDGAGTVLGALVGIVDWQRVQAELRALKIWGARQDADHRLVLRTSAGEVLYRKNYADEKSVGLPPAETGVRALKIGGRPFLVGTHVALAPDGISLDGWVLDAMVSTDVAYADMVGLRNRIAILSAAILAATLIFGALASARWIVNPIRAVTSAMRRVSAGDVDFTLDDQGRRDEIGQMLRAILVFRRNMLRDNALLHEREKALTTQNLRFDAALSNMSHGLSMFDRQGRLVVCNKRFEEMYGLTAELVKAGTPERRIDEHVRAAGLLTQAALHVEEEEGDRSAGDQRRAHEVLELSDGRIFAVSHEPMEGGGWVSTHEDVTERRRAEARISHMARHDALTGLPNRVLFRQNIEEALVRVPRGEYVAVLCLDLDYFKSVNDTLGHPIGDALLRTVSSRLQGCLREYDSVARLGGDEFALIQVGGEQPNAATALAQRIIAALGAPYDVEGHQIVVGASVGIAVAPTDGEDPDQLLKNADMALYRAKADGRGTYRFFEPEMDARMQSRRSLELDLRKALLCGEFELFYQPLVDLQSNQITCFEALLRWRHPERGMVSPAEFIPLAEEIGLIVPLGDWVLRQACADAAAWPEHVRVAVNLSAAQFRCRDLVLSVFNALARARLAPDRLELEITETVLLQDGEATLGVLHQFREMGVRVSMDDFGTGYSSLSYLRSFPFDKIKIDQSFIRDLASENDSLVIVRAVTTIGTSLGIATTAEGVETCAQLEQLRAEGCTEVQGFYLGRPGPVAEALELLRKQRERTAAAA